MKEPNGHRDCKFSLEVCRLPRHDTEQFGIGIKRKRLRGSRLAYRTLCREILGHPQWGWRPEALENVAGNVQSVTSR